MAVQIKATLLQKIRNLLYAMMRCWPSQESRLLNAVKRKASWAYPFVHFAMLCVKVLLVFCLFFIATWIILLVFIMFMLVALFSPRPKDKEQGVIYEAERVQDK